MTFVMFRHIVDNWSHLILNRFGSIKFSSVISACGSKKHEPLYPVTDLVHQKSPTGVMSRPQRRWSIKGVSDIIKRAWDCVPRWPPTPQFFTMISTICECIQERDPGITNQYIDRPRPLYLQEPQPVNPTGHLRLAHDPTTIRPLKYLSLVSGDCLKMDILA